MKVLVHWNGILLEVDSVLTVQGWGFPSVTISEFSARPASAALCCPDLFSLRYVMAR